MNIPIYRAKKIDSNEYVVGYLLPEFKGRFYLSTEWSSDMDGYTPDFVQINISTLSIHFPDMIDSNGNKIFASLQEDGKGGDLISLEHSTKTAIWCKKTQAIMLNSKSTGLSILSLYIENIEVIGIQKEINENNNTTNK